MRLKYFIFLWLNLVGLVSAQDRTLIIDTLDKVFINASSVSVDPTGCIFVADAGSNEITKFSSKGTIIKKFGGFGWSNNSLNNPADIITPTNLDVYVADYGNHRVVHLDYNLNFVASIPSEVRSDKQNRLFGYPLSVSLSTFGNLFILDGENIRLLQFSTSGQIERAIGGVDAGLGRLKNPRKTRVNGNNLIFVKDGKKIIAFDVFGNYLKTVGKGVFSDLSTFTTYDTNLFVVDSSMIIQMDQDAKKIKEIKLNRWIDESLMIVDLFVTSKQFYVLTKNRLFVIPRVDEN